MLDPTVFGWGCVGAIFPEVYRQYQLRGQESKEPFRFYVWTIFMVVLSGLVALALPGPLTPLSAIYAGFAAPFIISKGGEQFGRTEAAPARPQAPPAQNTETIDEVSGKTSDEIFIEVKGRLSRSNSWDRFIRSL